MGLEEESIKERTNRQSNALLNIHREEHEGECLVLELTPKSSETNKKMSRDEKDMLNLEDPHY